MNDNKLDPVVAALRTKRGQDGLSIRALAEKIGVSFSTLSRLERGEGTPDPNTKIKILNWLGGQIDTSEMVVEEVVQVHFRAAKNVDSKTVKCLAEVARLVKKKFGKE